MDNSTLRILEVVLFFANKVFAMTSKVPLKPFYRDIFILNEALVIWNNFEIFRNEVGYVYKNFKTIKNDMYFQNIVETEPEWTRLYLTWYNKVDPLGEKLCPKSSAIIKSLPNVKMAMGLITPNSDECFITLGGQTYSWRDGEVILLDDSYLHYVENNTDKYRVILLCDIIRPMNFLGTFVNNCVMNNFSDYTHRES